MCIVEVALALCTKQLNIAAPINNPGIQWWGWLAASLASMYKVTKDKVVHCIFPTIISRRGLNMQ